MDHSGGVRRQCITNPPYNELSIKRSFTHHAHPWRRQDRQTRSRQYQPHLESSSLWGMTKRTARVLAFAYRVAAVLVVYECFIAIAGPAFHWPGTNWMEWARALGGTLTAPALWLASRNRSFAPFLAAAGGLICWVGVFSSDLHPSSWAASPLAIGSSARDALFDSLTCIPLIIAVLLLLAIKGRRELQGN